MFQSQPHKPQPSRSSTLLRHFIATALVVLSLASTSTAFAPAIQYRATTHLYSDSSGSKVEQLEFKIYSDGRVEETVRGVKGNNCHKVTEGINEMLGKVVASEPTEEMYEQEVVVDQSLTQTVDGESSSGDAALSPPTRPAVR